MVRPPKQQNHSSAPLSLAERISAALARTRTKLVVMSGKGGVGKSSVAVNIAAALADAGYGVGLLDVDLHGPGVPGMLGLAGRMRVGEERIEPVRAGPNLQVVSPASLLVDPDQAVLWRGPMKTSAIRRLIADTRWGELDFLVIDTPPGTGEEHLTILKLIPDALCVVVTTPQETSLADVRKALHFLQYAQAGVLGVVENMSGLICPHCAEEIELFKKGGGRELAEHHGLPFLGAVPLDPATVVASELGTPVVLLDADTPVKRALLELTKRIAAEAETSLEAAVMSSEN